MIDRGGESVARELLSDLAGLQPSVGFPGARGQAELRCRRLVAGRDRLFGGPRPAELHHSRELG